MEDDQVFEALGFTWDRSLVPAEVPAHSIERAACPVHKALPEFVWDASVLEGNPPPRPYCPSRGCEAHGVAGASGA